MACALRWRALALGRAGRWLRWRWRWRRLRWNWKHHSCLLKIPEIPGMREIREIQDIRGIQGTLGIQENRDIRNSPTTLMGQKRIPAHLNHGGGPEMNCRMDSSIGWQENTWPSRPSNCWALRAVVRRGCADVGLALGAGCPCAGVGVGCAGARQRWANQGPGWAPAGSLLGRTKGVSAGLGDWDRDSLRNP